MPRSAGTSEAATSIAAPAKTARAARSSPTTTGSIGTFAAT